MTTGPRTLLAAALSAAVSAARSAARSAPLPAALLAAALLPAGVRAQTAPSAGPIATPVPQLSDRLLPGDSVLATPFGRYDAGPLHRWIMGAGHRDLWPRPVPAPVLDPGTFAGGLTVEGLGGGNQTRSLVFQGADGQEWRFRSIDKDAARSLDPELRRTLAAKVVQDQISHLFPLAAAVVSPLLEAAGVLHPRPTLVVLPDHPVLGEHRDEFRGMLGWMEVRPDEAEEEGQGFAGSPRVISSERLLERLEEDARNRLDAASYLRARLMDALVGDWDRHPDQWRWAGFEHGDTLVFDPVPRDRDWALSRLDGLVALFTWAPWPHYVGFDHDFPSAFRQTWSARALDRRLLSGLGREDFRTVAEDLQRRLDDGVIARAVATLPSTYPDDVHSELEAALRNRRDDLVRFTDEVYLLLAGWVDVHVTDEDEIATATWLEDGALALRVTQTDDPGAPALVARTFSPGETREVRLYLHGGDDQVTVAGAAGSPILLRLIGGGGDDRVEDRSAEPGRRVRVHDDRGDLDVLPAGRIAVDRGRWSDPIDPEENTHRAGHRDWGARTLPRPAIRYDPDLGLFAGLTVERVGYGFRQHPFRSRVAVTVAAASGTGQPDVMVAADLPLGDRRDLRVRLEGRAWGTEFHRFYGFGNETAADAEDGNETAAGTEGGSDRFAAPRRLLGGGAGLAWLPAAGWSVELGADLTAHRPFRQEGTLVRELAPYGAGSFSELSFALAARRDTRDHETIPRRGTLVEVRAEAAPPALDVETTYGALEGRAAAHWSAGDDVPGRPALALRAGGRTVLGTAPYHAAAFVGGPETLRGFRQERFAGESAVYAGAEVRTFLTEFVFLLPGDLGVLALADAGRVFVDGERSSRWHAAWGGGVWVSFLEAWAASLSLARGREDTMIYFRLGFPF